ncbi:MULTISPECIES: hypothetical protein [Bacillus]|uniref:Uncharacterized protein n=1 Tax=Bacillus anthracis TaxID=1392 RepID=A0A2A7DBN2_BACAN|nr:MULTISPECIES: hypothetical protein [Bacillus]MCP1162301.1 hypothetical protein [Bacillus sp. 1813sda1]PDZ17351.1 hypothetical protein CON16_10120 [Bacillus anthracis]PDZ52227.1 hypothetical protein CON07_06000 [Bacillus sp. AFS094611]
MSLTKNERTGFDYVIDSVFNPVISECQTEIESLLNEDQMIKSKVEEKLEQILKNRALKKAVNAESVVQDEESKEYSSGQILINTQSDFEKKSEKKFETNFTYINSKKNEYSSNLHLQGYNMNPNKLEEIYSFSTIEPVYQGIKGRDLEETNNDLALAV